MTDSMHIDLSQRYDGDFWTVCSCGLEFGGIVPDSADWYQLAHRAASEGQTDAALEIAAYVKSFPHLAARSHDYKKETSK